MYIFKQDIKMFDNIPNIQNIPKTNELPVTPLDYTKLHFFLN